jgi:hypothetical protein
MAEERAVDASSEKREIVVGAAVSIAGSPGCDWVVVGADDPILMQRSLGDPGSLTFVQIPWSRAAVEVLVKGGPAPPAPNSSGVRRSSRGLGLALKVPVGRSGRDLAEGDVVEAWNATLDGKDGRWCTGRVLKVQVLSDPPFLLVQYVSGQNQYTFEQARDEVRQSSLSEVCACGWCTPELAAVAEAGGLCTGFGGPPDVEAKGVVRLGGEESEPAAGPFSGDAQREFEGLTQSKQRLVMRHRLNAPSRRQRRAVSMVRCAEAWNHPPIMRDRPLGRRLEGVGRRRADLGAGRLLMVDFFSGSKSVAISAGRMARTNALTVDKQAIFNPDVVADFTTFNFFEYCIEKLQFLDGGKYYVMLPHHIHFSPSCLTHGTSSFWLYGRSHASPRSAAFALFEGFESDWCLENMIKMLSIMWSSGCISTTGIENPGSGTLWPMVRALMEEHGLDGRLVYTVVHYCMYGAPYRKPTTIAHSPELGVDWARRCNQKGDCGAMSWIGGSFIHGSRGSFGLEHAGLPPGLADGLNHAWRAHHARMLREDSRHGAMPLAVVREMSREYADYLAQVEPSRAPVRAAHAAERAAAEDGGVEGEPQSAWLPMEGCSDGSRPAPPAAAEEEGGSCQLCGDEGGGLQLRIGEVPACASCFEDHFSFDDTMPRRPG